MAAEVAMFAGMSYYLSNKIKGLRQEVEELKGKVNLQQSSIDKNFSHIYAVLEDIVSHPSSHFHHQNEEQKQPSELRNRKKNVQSVQETKSQAKQRKEKEYLEQAEQILEAVQQAASVPVFQFMTSPLHPHSQSHSHSHSNNKQQMEVSIEEDDDTQSVMDMGDDDLSKELQMLEEAEEEDDGKPIDGVLLPNNQYIALEVTDDVVEDIKAIDVKKKKNQKKT